MPLDVTGFLEAWTGRHAIIQSITGANRPGMEMEHAMR